MKSIHAPSKGCNPVMYGSSLAAGLFLYNPRPFGQRHRFRLTVRDRVRNEFWAQWEQIRNVVTLCNAEA